LPIVFALKLANQSLRDQFQIAVKFQMIFLCVAAAAASAPTTLRSDQRCNRLLVGGCAVGPSEGAVQQNKRTKSEGKTHGPPTQVGQFGVDTTSTPRTCSQVLVCSKRPHGLRLSPPADNFSLAGSFQTRDWLRSSMGVFGCFGICVGLFCLAVWIMWQIMESMGPG
jgi:hypothetical protein